MRRPTTLESVVERLAILDEQIETLQGWLVALRDRGQVTETLEQTLDTLTVSRALLHKSLDMFAGEPKSIQHQDGLEISIQDAGSISHWCNVLSCNEAELRFAVWKVGPSALLVTDFLDSLPSRTKRDQDG